MIVGTAAALAVCAVLAVAIGTVARRGAAAVAAVVALIAAPYVLTVSVPVLPLGAADWLMRVTPAAAFAVEQTVVQYPQVADVYAPAYGYFPLPSWAGFAVLCGWAAVFLTLAALALNRRDA
jgi:ABC-type transport system involved in multi-copper enzyme maturation permease subunit